MALESGQYISFYLSEETSYGVPVAPMAKDQIDVVSFNFSDAPNYVPDDTVYSPYPDVFDEEEGHSNASFEGVCHIPMAQSGTSGTDTAKRTGFTKLMEAAFGKVVKAADASSANGVLPTYGSGDKFYGISGNKADEFVCGEDPAENSFTFWKKTRTGHEVGVGCVITEIEFAFGLNQYVRVTFRGQCAEWAKFEPGTLQAAITSGNKTSFDFNKTSGMIGKGAYVKVLLDSNSDSAALLITAFDKKNSRTTFAQAMVGAAAAGKAVKDAMPNPNRENRLMRSIWGDNIRVSLNGGVSVINKVRSCTVRMSTGVQLFNEDNTQLYPSEAYMGPREINLTADAVVDPNDLTLPRAGFYGEDQHVQLLAGGLTGATNGGRLLLRMPVIRMRRNAPDTPNDGLSSIQLTGMARAQLTAAGAYTGPLLAYIR